MRKVYLVKSKTTVLLAACLIFAASLKGTSQPAAQKADKIPVIFDTDIGGDIDDT